MVTGIGLHPTQDISSKSNFNTSSCTSKVEQPVRIQQRGPKRNKMLYAPLCFKKNLGKLLFSIFVIPEFHFTKRLRKKILSHFISSISVIKFWVHLRDGLNGGESTMCGAIKKSGLLDFVKLTSKTQNNYSMSTLDALTQPDMRNPCKNDLRALIIIHGKNSVKNIWKVHVLLSNFLCDYLRWSSCDLS